MTINLITFASALNKDADVQQAHQPILSELEKHYTINLIDHKDIGKLSNDDFSIIFIATGGVERMVAQIFEELPRPVIMLADGLQNSLAAALEISSWFRSRGVKNEILHGTPKQIIERIDRLYVNFRVQRSLTGTRVGVIGTSSAWLIASNVDYLLAKRRWGVEYIDIPLERVYDLYDRITDDEVGEASAEFAGRAKKVLEGEPEDLIKAMKLYKAIRQICEEENLQALTLSCFKIIEKMKNTGCVALALLNDEGIPAGCEGDLQTVFTMLIAKSFTGQTGFMANPSMIDTFSDEVILAHCSIGIKQTEKYTIRSHFESGLGIAIQGVLPVGEVTLVKCGGEALDEYYLTSGILLENTNYLNLCRTQVRVKLDTSADYFLKNPLGNHHVLIQGNHVEALQEFFQANACKRIE